MQFAIHALQSQQPVSLTLDAADAQEARLRAEQRGLAVLSVQPLRRAWPRLGRAPAFPLLHFNHSLLLLLKAGLSIVEAVDTLAEREARADVKQVLTQLRARLGVGLSMSAALSEQPAAFPSLYVAGVRANETTGGLVDAIERFIHYQTRAEQLRKRLVGAAIYPMLILGVGMLVVLFLLLYVVPRFSVVFEDMGDRVPWMARLLLDWGRFMHAHGNAVGLTLLAATAVLAWASTRPGVRAALARGLMRIPRLGEFARVYQLARFYRALGMLMLAGTPVLQALDLARGLLPLALQDALALARRDIAQGITLSSAFDSHGLATPVSRRLFRVAEQTGAMGEMLERTAGFHDEDIAQSIEWAVRLFEPLLMVLMGVVIGGVVLLMYSPIFELAGSLQ